MGSMLFAINPGSNFDSMYEEYEPGSTPKEDYDIATLVPKYHCQRFSKLGKR